MDGRMVIKVQLVLLLERPLMVSSLSGLWFLTKMPSQHGCCITSTLDRLKMVRGLQNHE